jgi:molybdate-binding protein/DNA-binding transcriptional regulator YhcF (GntR family)
MQATQAFAIQVDEAAATPLYKQISEYIKLAIASDQIPPGERLPTVRALAQTLRINPGTVVRAYLELEQEKIIVSRRGGGTTVAAKSDDPMIVRSRQQRLSNMVSGDILRALSLGYSPEELEAAFSLHLSRWRAERKTVKAASPVTSETAVMERTISIAASNDLALDLLVSKLKEKDPDSRVTLTHAGSLGGLIALHENRAHIAGIHLLDEETGEYNYPYLKRLLPGRRMVIVNLAFRIQGLMFRKHNPRGISGIEDVWRKDVAFINRQQGSGTRVLLDMELHKHGIRPGDVQGYDREVDTHFAVAVAVAKGTADTGLGIEAAAYASDLDFLPLFREKYDLVIPAEHYRSSLISPVVDIVTSADFSKAVGNIAGYDNSQTGTTQFFG